MKKCLAILLLLFIFIIPVQATENDYSQELIENSGAETEQLLESIGIEQGTYEELMNIDFASFCKKLLDMCKMKLKSPVVCICTCISIMMLVLFVQSVMVSDTGLEIFTETIAIIFLMFSVLSPLISLLNEIIDVNTAINKLVKILIPCLTVIITAAGNPGLALSVQTVSLGVGQAVSASLNGILPSFSAVYAALTIGSAINTNLNLNAFAQFLKKAFSFILTATAVLFSGMLSIKSIISVSADTVAMKGARFIIGSSVPIVGSALAESLNSVIAGIGLLRSTYGMLGIIILAMMVLPILTELLLWSFSLRFLQAIADSIGQVRCSTLFNSCVGLLSVMIAVTVYQAFLYIISVSVVVMISKT